MADSIFTKIIKGEIPSHKIYEDDKSIAFLDIHPKTPGHTLVVPKKPIDQFQDLPDEDYEAVMRTVKKVAQRLKQVLSPARIGVEIMGMDVPHAHVHVFGFNSMTEYRNIVDMGTEPDHVTLSEMAKKLSF
ncbi:HIT family protein [Candidatus Saccharibacteria bacterium]|nr:HIT family protein [Candidatus Saccharibacteria bacterium]